MQDPETTFQDAYARTVEVGNTIASDEKEIDVWDVADGILAGALQFWLYSRQPCGDPSCEDCATLGTSAARMTELRKLVEHFTSESDYFHTPLDQDVGRA